MMDPADGIGRGMQYSLLKQEMGKSTNEQAKRS